MTSPLALPSQPLPDGFDEEEEEAALAGERALAPPPGPRRPPHNLPPLSFTIVRPLTEADRGALARPARATPSGSVVDLRSRHHQIAQLIAEGKRIADVALITGYQAAYVGQLQDNPAFQALVAHYAGVNELIRVDAVERLNALGVQATELLQERLDRTGEDEVPTGQLLELIDMAIARPHTAAVKATGAVAAAQAAPRAFQVVFRSAGERPAPSGPLIEGEAAE